MSFPRKVRNGHARDPFGWVPLLTLAAGRQDAEVVTFMFESPNQEKISDFEMKLMVIDSEHLGIPETEYNSEVTMPSGEFQKICRDLTTFGDTGELPCPSALLWWCCACV